MKATNPELKHFRPGMTVHVTMVVTLESLCGDSVVGYVGNGHRVAIPESAHLYRTPVQRVRDAYKAWRK